MRNLTIPRRKKLPQWGIIFLLSAITIPATRLVAEDLPLIPLQSEVLQKKVAVLNQWKKQTELAVKLPYFSSQTQSLVLDQYLMNAKIFLIRSATQAMMFPLSKLELKADFFQANFFEFTKKYCQVDARNNFDWGSLTRQLFLQAKNERKNLRWDDAWSKGNFALEVQQKIYTARITKSLDAIKALCISEDNSIDSMAKYFLKDDAISLYFTQFMQNAENPKFFCESSLFCRQLIHAEFVQRLPKSMLDLEYKQEVVDLWKTAIEDYSPNWEDVKKKHQHLSSVSTEMARLNLRDELIGVSDFFSVTKILTKDINNVNDDPMLKSIRPLIDQYVALKLDQAAKKITWEEPLEISIETPGFTKFATTLSMDIKVARGGLDTMIDKLEKFKISDQVVFDRGFMEWFLRATLNIRYYNEQLYWSNVEAIQNHLLKKFDNYIAQRKSTLPYLGYEKKMASIMTQWFIEHRNDIAQVVVQNPEQKVFPLLINHYLGLSALETHALGE